MIVLTGVRRLRDRGRRDARRRVRLRHQARRDRRARARDRGARPSAARCAARSSACASVVAEARRFAAVSSVRAPAMQQTCTTLIEQVGPTDATVLDHRRARHRQGGGRARDPPRSRAREAGPFVAVNCAAMPEALLESELFGHAKGAFTGAKHGAHGPVRAGGRRHAVPRRDRRDARDRVQPKLLRVLQERKRAPGRRRHRGRRRRARRRARRTAISRRWSQRAQFREDLYYRLNVDPDRAAAAARARRRRAAARAALPRSLRADVRARRPWLVARGGRAAASRYAWPGNVRELRNAIERAVALCAEARDLPSKTCPSRIRDYRRHRARSRTASIAMPSCSRSRRSSAATSCACSRRRRATSGRSQSLGLDRKTLYRKLVRYGVERES